MKTFITQAIAATLRQPYFRNKHNRTRTRQALYASLALTVAPVMLPSITPISSAFAEDSFSLIIAGDPQLYWWRGGDDPSCNDSACVEAMGIASNQDVVAAMNNIEDLGFWPETPDPFDLSYLIGGGGNPVTQPEGIIVNGDLTAFWHEAQQNEFLDIYRQLNHQIYPGLGNHDYANNVNDCTFNFIYHPDDNRCAKEAVWWMASQVSDLPNIVNHDVPGFVAVRNSGAYDIRFSVTYNDENGVFRSAASGRYPVLQWRTEGLPPGATNIHVDIDYNTGCLVEFFCGPEWRNLREFSVSTPATACFESTGSLFNTGARTRACPGSVLPDGAVVVPDIGFGIPDGGLALPDSSVVFPNGSSGSLAYSFDMGNYHFIQLHNYPGYEVDLPRVTTVEEILSFGINDSPGFTVTSSYDWLADDLAAATAAGKYSIINMHDWVESHDGGVAAIDDERFHDAIRDQNLAAIFGAHIHSQVGRVRTLSNGLRDDIPVFYSGSAEFYSFLYLEFHDRHFNFGAVDAETGQPIFESEGSGDLGSYDLNLAPTDVLAELLSANPTEGQALQFAASASDPEGDAISFEWNFGDGSAVVTGANPSHVYPDNGPFTVTVEAIDEFGAATMASIQISVANVAPSITVNGSVINENGTATVSGTIRDPGSADTFTAIIDWGEGVPTSHTYAAGTTSFSESYQYLDDNPSATPSDDYTVNVVLTDDDGGSDSASTTVTVNNIAPVAAIDSIVDELGSMLGTDIDIVLMNQQVTVTASVTDIGSQDSHIASIDWGNEASNALGDVVNGSAVTAYAFSGIGSQAISVTFTDDDSGSDTAVQTINVVDAAGALNDTASDLSDILATPDLDPAAADAISKGLDQLIGANAGTAANGALDKLNAGQLGTALRHILLVIDSLQQAQALNADINLLFSLRQLALTARSIATDAVNSAVSAATKPADLRKVSDAQTLLETGNTLLINNGDVNASVNAYWDAVKLIENLL